MDNLLHRLNLSVRLLKGEGKHTLAQYIAGQLETLQRIQEGAPYLLCTYYVPPELLLLYDVEVLYIERIVGLTVSTGLLDGLSGLPAARDLFIPAGIFPFDGAGGAAKAMSSSQCRLSLRRCGGDDGTAA